MKYSTRKHANKLIAEGVLPVVSLSNFSALAMALFAETPVDGNATGAANPPAGVAEAGRVSDGFIDLINNSFSDSFEIVFELEFDLSVLANVTDVFNELTLLVDAVAASISDIPEPPMISPYLLGRALLAREPRRLGSLNGLYKTP